MERDLFVNILVNYHYPLSGISLGLGTLLNVKKIKKRKYKERLEVFSSAKSEIEKIEEEMINSIEYKKVSNRNLIIEEVISKINYIEDEFEKRLRNN